MRRGLSVLVTVVALASMVACGGESPSKAGAPVKSTPAKSDKVRARAILLTGKDLSGWKRSASDEPGTDDEFDKKFAACAGIKNAHKYETADVAGDDFGHANQQVGGGVTFYTTAARAKADFVAFFSARTIACARGLLDDAIRAEFKKQGVTGLTITSLRLVRAPIVRYADQSGKLTFSATIHVAGQSVPFFLDFVGLRKGRIDTALDFLNIGTRFPAALEAKLISKVAARMVIDGGA
jgi:hypothetical protein